VARFLGVGMTHYPLLAGTDEHMAGLLRFTLRDPDIPAAEKDPANWPASMRADWSDDGGTAAAARHRKELRENLARCRAELDAFGPDLVVVWGDDQYENFREEVVPPFCVLAYGDIEVPAFEVMNERGSPNAWGRPDDMTFTLHGDAQASRELADTLIADGFDWPTPTASGPARTSRTRSSTPSCSWTTTTRAPGSPIRWCRSR
jgi:hypothetical protein